jgi:hypothetical protein
VRRRRSTNWPACHHCQRQVETESALTVRPCPLHPYAGPRISKLYYSPTSATPGRPLAPPGRVLAAAGTPTEPASDRYPRAKDPRTQTAARRTVGRAGSAPAGNPLPDRPATATGEQRNPTPEPQPPRRGARGARPRRQPPTGPASDRHRRATETHTRTAARRTVGRGARPRGKQDEAGNRRALSASTLHPPAKSSGEIVSRNSRNFSTSSSCSSGIAMPASASTASSP